jgi:protein-arginine kinase activator protein McsA
MEVCVKCGVQIKKFEVFPKQVCVKCYGIQFQKEWESIVKVGRLK